MSIRNVKSIFHEKLGITIRYLLYELVLFHRNCTRHCSFRTGVSTNLCIPDYRYHTDWLTDEEKSDVSKLPFKSVTAKTWRKWMIYRATRIAHKALGMYSDPPADLNIHSQNTTFRRATCLRPQVKCNIKIPCVLWPQLNTALSWFIWLGRQSRSKKGLEFKVLYYNQKMDKG